MSTRASYAKKLAPATTHTKKTRSWKRTVLKRVVSWVIAAILVFYTLISIVLVLLRSIDPPFTAVQIERRLGAAVGHLSYRKRYSYVSLDQISPQLQHAVIAAEDTRFFQHHGFDWKEVSNAVEEDIETGRQRGASTITQQLARNLFLSTGRSAFRKVVEFSIVPLMEGILSKNRILELYLNVIEWGPGVFGAEAASQYYFEIPASRITPEQAAELAEILPAPLHRKPNHLTPYGTRILKRMRQMGY